MVDKIIIFNKSALQAKYAAAGFAALQNAIDQLIAADATRNIATQCVWVDDAAAMKKFGATPPVNTKDQRGYKTAIDAVANALSPDYMLILDGPDIVPHIVLDNPAQDDDATIDSDLPYASPAGFSRQVARYLKVTRVVGRVPNVPAATDPANIIGFLDNAASAQPQAADLYSDYYGLSAKEWEQSTQMSLDAAFGNHQNLDLSPPVSPPTNDAQLARLSHFINCHGAPLSPEFVGQDGSSYPTALTSAQVAGHGVRNVVVAAECCYGGQLYDPALAGTNDPICIAYLIRGALGFVGSTNIAYGPATSNGQADLITQYFFENVLKGASLGRAFLQAQQRFITTQKMTNPMNLKTLGQFLLLGDSSVCPCIPPKEVAESQASLSTGDVEDAKAERKLRRISLTSTGNSISDGKAIPVRDGDLSEAVKTRVRAIARDRGYNPQAEVIFSVRGNADYRRAMKELADKKTALVERVMVLTERRSAPPNVIDIRHVVAHIVGEGIASIEESVSR